MVYSTKRGRPINNGKKLNKNKNKNKNGYQSISFPQHNLCHFLLLIPLKQSGERKKVFDLMDLDTLLVQRHGGLSGTTTDAIGGIFLLAAHVRGASGLLKVGAHIRGPDGIIMHVQIVIVTAGLFGLAGLALFPVGAHLLDFLLVVEFGVVVLAGAAQALPQRQVVGVDGDTVVVVFTAGTDELPAAFLLFEIETGGVWKEDEGEDGAEKAEPWHGQEDLRNGDVVVEDGGQQGTGFTARSRETVSRGADRGWVDLSSDEESDCVGTELIEEGGEEVHGLEFLDVGFRSVVFEIEGRDNEENEAQHEADQLHVSAAVQLVVDEES